MSTLLPALGPHDRATGGRHHDGMHQSQSDSYLGLREKSKDVMKQRYAHRETIQEQIMDMQERTALRAERVRRKRQQQWAAKLASSPFKVNLLADEERTKEESRVLSQEDARLAKAEKKQKDRLKNHLVMQALRNVDEFEILRADKRRIAQAEKRLKAIADVQKSEARIQHMQQIRHLQPMETASDLLDCKRAYSEQQLAENKDIAYQLQHVQALEEQRFEVATRKWLGEIDQDEQESSFGDDYGG